jgi:hypothetical protein
MFLGWLRFLLFLISAISMGFVSIPLAFLRNRCARYHSHFACWYARHFFIRFGAFCLRVYRVQWHGKPDRTTRCFVYDHVSRFDGAFVCVGSPSTIVTSAGIGATPIIGPALKASGAHFVEHRGTGLILAEHINTLESLPLAVAPERMMSNGGYLF